MGSNLLKKKGVEAWNGLRKQFQQKSQKQRGKH